MLLHHVRAHAESGDSPHVISEGVLSGYITPSRDHDTPLPRQDPDLDEVPHRMSHPSPVSNGKWYSLDIMLPAFFRCVSNSEVSVEWSGW